MPARPGDRNPKAAASQGLRYCSVGAGAIQHDMRSHASREWTVLIKVPHAAQIAFTLFTHVAQHHQCGRQFYPCAQQGMNNGQHAHHTGRVIARARCFQSVAGKDWIERRIGGKHRIKMRRKQNHRPGILRRQFRGREHSQHIARGIGFYGADAGFSESRGQPSRALLLAVRGRGNAHQIDLPIHEGFGICVQPGECRVNRPLRSQSGHA